MSKPPSYSELAQLIVDLAEMNVANIDRPESIFVSCYTFEGNFPDLWFKAVKFRRVLLEGKMATRGNLYVSLSKDKVRKMLARREAHRE